jgi:hypothetical protein
VSQQLVPPPCTAGHVLWHSASVVHEPHVWPPLLEPLLDPVPLLEPEEPLLDPVPLLEPVAPLLDPVPLLEPVVPLLEPVVPLLDPLLDPLLEPVPPSSPKLSPPDEESPDPQAATRMATKEKPTTLPSVELRMAAPRATVVPALNTAETAAKRQDGRRAPSERPVRERPVCPLRVQLGRQGRQQNEVAPVGVAAPVAAPPPETAHEP